MKKNEARNPSKEVGLPEIAKPQDREKPHDTTAGRQVPGYTVDQWELVDEKSLQKGDRRRAKNFYSRGGEEQWPLLKRIHGDLVQHIFREHSREADQMAELGCALKSRTSRWARR